MYLVVSLSHNAILAQAHGFLKGSYTCRVVPMDDWSRAVILSCRVTHRSPASGRVQSSGSSDLPPWLGGATSCTSPSVRDVHTPGAVSSVSTLGDSRPPWVRVAVPSPSENVCPWAPSTAPVQRGVKRPPPAVAPPSNVGAGLSDAVAHQAKTPVATHWSAGRSGSVKEQSAHEQSVAVNHLMNIVLVLETDFRIELGVRALAADDKTLRALLTPRRPGTAMRHCRLWKRCEAFVRLDIALLPSARAVHRSRVLRWF